MHFLGYFVQGSRVQKLVPDELKHLSSAAEDPSKLSMREVRAPLNF